MVDAFGWVLGLGRDVFFLRLWFELELAVPKERNAWERRVLLI